MQDDKPVRGPKRAKSGDAATTVSLSKKASPVKPAKQPATKSAPARAVTKAKSKVHVIDSDSDDDDNDDDFLPQKAEEEEDIEMEVDSDEEEPPKQKTARFVTCPGGTTRSI